MPNHAADYFKKRDQKAIPFLKKLLPTVNFKQLTGD